MRMLNCPFRSPFKASNRLPGKGDEILRRVRRLKTIELQAGGPFDSSERLDSLSVGEVSLRGPAERSGAAALLLVLRRIVTARNTASPRLERRLGHDEIAIGRRSTAP
jgi:hypothetical protein